MSHPTPAAPTEGNPPRIIVRRVDDPHQGPCWRVTYPCGCGRRQFRTWQIALIFATAHRCPRPWTPLPAARPYVRGGVR